MTDEYSRIWQISPDLLSVLHINDGTFLSVNPAWTAALGWTADEMVGHVFTEFLHPDDQAGSLRVYRSLVEGEPVLDHVNRYRHRDGSYRMLSWVAVADGDRLYARTRDVTAEHRRDVALADSIAERDRAWRASQDLLAVFTLKGKIEAVNERWTTLLGWAEDDLVGHLLSEFVHEAEHQALNEAFEAVLRGPLTTPRQRRMRHKDGSYRWFGWTAAHVNDRVYGSARDMTVERAHAEALQQAQKMDALGQLTGGIAHDFNNLLTGVLGSLELIQVRNAKGETAQVERFARAAQGAAQRAAALTQRLLAFARRQPLDPVATNVHDLVTGMAELIRRTVGPQIEMAVEAPDTPWPVLIDASGLENALLNLCINARDAMPHGGRIAIDISNCDIGEHTARLHDLPTGHYVQLSVADTGAGMEKAVLARAFEPFFTTKPVGVGTGMGLSMVYGFAKQSGGRAVIVSEVGRGTVVKLFLPRHDGEIVEAKPTPETALPPAQPAADKTVLLVDDEPTVRSLVAEILTDQGYRCIEANDSAAGLRILSSAAPIDLLIADIGMPGSLNGREMAELGRQCRPELRVLLITGYTENSVVSNGVLPPWMSLLTKPFTVAALTLRVREMSDPPLA